jgi:hypothetical protein
MARKLDDNGLPIEVAGRPDYGRGQHAQPPRPVKTAPSAPLTPAPRDPVEESLGIVGPDLAAGGKPPVVMEHLRELHHPHHPGEEDEDIPDY